MLPDIKKVEEAGNHFSDAVEKETGLPLSADDSRAIALIAVGDPRGHDEAFFRAQNLLTPRAGDVIEVQNILGERGDKYLYQEPLEDIADEARTIFNDFEF